MHFQFRNYIPLFIFLTACSSTAPLTSNKKNDQQVFGKRVQVSPSRMADTIYFNGDIITMEDDRTPVEAIAINGGKIAAVGPKEEIAKLQGPTTKMVDLMGKTLMPGFVDGHSHIAEYTLMVGTPDLNSPPVGDVRSISDIVTKMKRYITQRSIPPGQVVYGIGYDDSLLKEKRHPTAKELDAISNTNPLFILHSSGHLAVANSLMLKQVGFTKGAQDPEGGRIVRNEQGVPTGLVEEQAVFLLGTKIPMLSMDEKLQRFDQVQKFYASYGITTAQDGLTSVSNLKMLQEAAKKNRLMLDVVSYPMWTAFSQMMAGEAPKNLENQISLPGYHGDSGIHLKTNGHTADPDFDGRTRYSVVGYDNRLKIGGFKITQDGSPQGRTAYLSEPYFKVPPGQKSDYRGYPILTQQELNKWIEAAYKNQVQVIVHCNGDAAADMMIEAVEKAQDKYGKENIRPVMIHAQTVREDQLDKMKTLGITPSFFSAHTYYWGDWHRDVTLGPERAARISPLASALKREMIFANHTDAPVVPPNQLALVDSAVNRTTRTGKVLGPEQKISPKEALRAVTINSAYLYFEENSKGSLKAGKMADLVLLSGNPLKVNPSSIKTLEVLETVKEGKTIYQKTLSPAIDPRLSQKENETLKKPGTTLE